MEMSKILYKNNKKYQIKLIKSTINYLIYYLEHIIIIYCELFTFRQIQKNFSFK